MTNTIVIDNILHSMRVEEYYLALSHYGFPWFYRDNNSRQTPHHIVDYGMCASATQHSINIDNIFLSNMNNNNYFYSDIYNESSFKKTILDNGATIFDSFGHILSVLYIRSLIRFRTCMYLKTSEPRSSEYDYDYMTTNRDISSVYTIDKLNENNLNTDLKKGKKNYSLNESLTPCNDSKVAILCTHNSNGKIDIDGEVIDIKENRLICFPNNLRYSIITQTDVDRQFLLHINFF